MIIKRNNFFILIICLFIYSCSGIPNEAVTNYERETDEIINDLNSNSNKIYSVFADGSVTIDSPEIYNSGSIEFGIIKPDSIYIKISGPFGISIARLNINSDKFTYYNVQENYVIKGSSTAGNLGAILQLKISFADIINGFAYSFKINKLNYDSLAVNNLSLLTEIQTFESPDNKTVYFVNNETNNLVKVISEDKDNYIEVDYDKFRRLNGINYPTNIIINNKNLKQTIFLDLSTVKLNSKINYQTVKYPVSARIIEWN